MKSKFANFGGKLSRDEMKTVVGGQMQATCGYKSSTGTVGCGVSKAEALFMTEGGGNWCCDSCGSSSYCG